MDTQTLISDARARFNHSSAKAYLKEKYDSKLIIADQGGLWKVNLETINFLNASTSATIILIDTFANPVKVNRSDLLTKLQAIYDETMQEWYDEWMSLENKR